MQTTMSGEVQTYGPRQAPAGPEAAERPRSADSGTRWWSQRVERLSTRRGLAPSPPAGIAEARSPSASTRRDSVFRRGLVLADVLAISAAFLITMFIVGRGLGFTWVALAGLPILVVGAKALGLYDRDETLLRKTTLDEAPKLFQLATLCALATWLADGVILHGELTRPEVLTLWLSLALCLVGARKLGRSVALRVAPAERCLLIGDDAAAQTLKTKLSEHGGINAEIVGHIDLEDVTPWTVAVTPQQRHEAIAELVQSLEIHRAVIAPRSADAGEILEIITTLKAVGARVSVLPRLLEVVGSSVEFDDLHGVTVMGVRRFELTRSSAALKRGLDLLSASIGLVAVSPLMLAIAAAVKLDGRGPVFFRQVRVGREGVRFDVLKFRTMVDGAEAMKDELRHRNEAQDGLFKIAEDPRVTRVGRFLRKSAMDELPQLFNVLRGEMSLVGPRPLVLDEDEQVQGRHRERLQLMPGMTGHWQILGPTKVSLSEMAAIDYLYVANWSLWGDVKVLLRTIPYVVGRRGL
jgi:exopolysaccharide biosynthesis polyprenyl glycosylphosphotransferase